MSVFTYSNYYYYYRARGESASCRPADKGSRAIALIYGGWGGLSFVWAVRGYYTRAEDQASDLLADNAGVAV